MMMMMMMKYIFNAHLHDSSHHRIIIEGHDKYDKKKTKTKMTDDAMLTNHTEFFTLKR